MLKTKKEIKQWLDKVSVKGYSITDDLTVNVDGSVWLLRMNLTEIPVQFGTIFGYFDCSENQLTSLRGSPTKVYQNFNCSNNQLTNLDNCPQLVSGLFTCRNNPITDLSNFSTVFKNYFIHSGSLIPDYEYLYHEVMINTMTNKRELRMQLKHEELMSVIFKVRLKNNLSELPFNETTTKKPKI